VPLRVFKPTSPARRLMSGYTFEEITKDKPEKSLIVSKTSKAGRNNQGRIAVRHRGNGVKRSLRVIDFKRDKFGIAGRVAAIEYDPNRSARIALVYYADGEKRYILAPLGVNVGDKIMSGENAEIKPGNALPMRLIPGGTLVHNIEMEKGKGGQMARTAGASAQIMAKEGDYVLLKLPSGEMRRVPSDCFATIGQLGNIEHETIKYGKAGRRRLMGWRPTVRGAAMSPRDHPHGGGGGGHNSIGLPGPRTHG